MSTQPVCIVMVMIVQHWKTEIRDLRCTHIPQLVPIDQSTSKNGTGTSLQSTVHLFVPDCTSTGRQRRPDHKPTEPWFLFLRSCRSCFVGLCFVCVCVCHKTAENYPGENFELFLFGLTSRSVIKLLHVILVFVRDRNSRRTFAGQQMCALSGMHMDKVRVRTRIFLQTKQKHDNKHKHEATAAQGRKNTATAS